MEPSLEDLMSMGERKEVNTPYGKLECVAIRDPPSGGYTVIIKKDPNIIIDADNIEKIEKEVNGLLKAVMTYRIRKKLPLPDYFYQHYREN